MADVQLATNAAPDYAIHHLLACGDRNKSDRDRNARSRFSAIDIAPGELGALLPAGGYAIIDNADRAPVAGGVYWVIVNGDPAAMRCVSPDPRSFVPIAGVGDDVPPAPVSGRSIWAVLGRVISYGREMDGADLSV